MATFDLTSDVDPSLPAKAGDTYPKQEFEWVNDAIGTTPAEPVDLTGAYIHVKIRDKLGGVILAVGRTSNAPAAPDGVPTWVITITDAAAGQWQWEAMPPAVTRAMIQGKQRATRCVYDQEVVWPSGVVTTPFGGLFEVTPDST